MSKKAKLAALKAHPDHPTNPEIAYGRRIRRAVFQEGYERAEKEYRLTPEDLQALINLIREYQPGHVSTTSCYKEVIDRFYAARDGQ